VLKDIEFRFLLVFLSIETILQETTIYRRGQRLSAVKNGLGLGGVYEATLGRIKAQGGDKARLGMAALMWISHSRRPLQVDEICHALAIRIGSNDFDNDDIPAISTLLGCCQGLVTVDKGASTIRLIHFTLQEHLCTHPNLFDRAHSTMAEACLTYLNFQRVKDLSACPSPGTRGLAFLGYSSLYWGTHMQMEPSNLAKEFALMHLDQFDSHISAKFLWESTRRGFHFWYTPSPRSFSALHCVSYFGFAEVANILIKEKRLDVNQGDGVGMTPLMWAARYGHEEVVGLFLREKHIQSDWHDTYKGRTALSWAAENGHEGVVRLLLGPLLVNPARIDRWWGRGRTALSWAAENGHEGVARLLLSPLFVNPASIGRWWGKGPRVVGLLLGNSNSLRTLLTKTGTNQCEASEDFLNRQVFGGRCINPNTSDWGGRTPLSWAAGNGYEGIVKLLLGQEDVSPDTGDAVFGQTPLFWAARNGHDGIAELLLARKDVNPNSSDWDGRAPLSWAAGNGHEGIVRRLLEREHVNPNGSSESGETPLSLAARNGHEGIVKLLLGWEGVSLDTVDGVSGQTPLSRAAKHGREGVVKLLLGRSDVNPNTRDARHGQTPLAWAARNGHEAVVRLLLKRKDVHRNTSDPLYGQTPLSLAAKNGHVGIVELLLGQKYVNPDSLCKSGETPLLLAAVNNHEGVVKLLLEWKDVYRDTCGPRYSQTPLRWVARGHEGILKLLLGRKVVDPNRSSGPGWTALSLAARNGYEGVVKLLLGRDDINPDIPDTKYGRTPLSWAAEEGHEGVVKLLLGREDVNLNSSSRSGQTPLTLAAENGHDRVVELLQVRHSRRVRQFGTCLAP